MAYACLHAFSIWKALCIAKVPEKEKPILNHLRIFYSACSFLIAISQVPEFPISQERQMD